MIPTSTKQSKPKLCRALRALANDNYKNIRNGTDNPVPVSEDTGRATRKRRAASGPAEDETVIQILGRTAQTSTDTPLKQKEKVNVVETVTDKDIDIPTLKKDKTNVILPWGDLMDFQTENFCCRVCHEPLTTSCFEKVQVGFATSINYYCKCRRIAKLEAVMKKKSKETCEGIYQNHTKASGDYDYHVPRLMSEYAMNLKMVLALQQMGQGKTGAGILGGMFSIIPEG